ncbi:hypothetical protein SEPCBS57363_005603 [Sporothrix epigloea]|uniref:Set domain containing protein n=1 Tax=Sporothrix epigloea TaxID=1892477 RepID=A0ABP0E0R1_9PEZI
MVPRQNVPEVIELTDEPEDRVEELEIVGSITSHKPRPPPLSYEHPGHSHRHIQKQSQRWAQQEQHFASSFRVADAVPASSSFNTRPLRTTASTTQQIAPKSSRASLGLDVFYDRQYGSSNVPVSRAVSSSSFSAAAGITSSPARSSDLQKADNRPGSICDPTSLSGFKRQPSSQSTSHWQYENASRNTPAAASVSLSTRSPVDGTSDYNWAQSGQKSAARTSFGSTPNTVGTPSASATSRNGSSLSLPAHSWTGRSPPLATSTTQRQQLQLSPTSQSQNTNQNSHRQLLRQSTPPQPSALANDLLYYQRQTMSFWDAQMRDQLRSRQRAQEAERQRDSQRQAERQGLLDQNERQEQQRQLEQQELRRARELQEMEERTQQEKQNKHKLQQEEYQKQQQQDKSQRLHRLQRQQEQQQQHLANAHAQAQAQQEQTQQHHRTLHLSASTSRLEVFSSRRRSPPLQSSQRSSQGSPLLQPATSTALWSAPLASAGNFQPSQRPSQTYSSPNPAGSRSSSAGEPPARKSSLHQLLTPHRRDSPQRSSPSKPTQSLAQIGSSTHSHQSPHRSLRQETSSCPPPDPPSTAPASSRLDQPTCPQQEAASQRTQQLRAQQQLAALSPNESLLRNASSQQGRSRRGYSRGLSTPVRMQMTSPRQVAAPADIQAMSSCSPSRPREPPWSAHPAPANKPAQTKASPFVQKRAAVLLSVSAHQDASAHSSWAGPVRDPTLAGRPPSPTRCASSPSSLSTASSCPSPRLEGLSAASATASMSNVDALKKNGQNHAHVHVEHYQASITAQFELLAEFNRPQGPFPSQPSSINPPVPPLSLPLQPSLPLHSPSLATPLRQVSEDANRRKVTILSRNTCKRTTRDRDSSPDTGLVTHNVEEVPRHEALQKNEASPFSVRLADRSEKSLHLELFEAEAQQLEDLQASVLLQDARHAEAMQAVEAQRVDAMQIDTIPEENLRHADMSADGSVPASAYRPPRKTRTTFLARLPSSKRTLRPRDDWTVAKLTSLLEEFLESLLVDHGRDVEYAIDLTKPRTRPVCSSFDEFADLPAQTLESNDVTTSRVLVCGKLYRDNQRRPEARTVHVKVIPLRSPGKAVPKYRFHHVEIAKNILSPNTPLMFIPHLRDFENNSDEKRKHDQWIEELEIMERKSGFDSSKLFQKGDTTRRNEFTKLLSDYLDHWIARLGIDNCNKAFLIRYMANESQKSNSIATQQKSSLLNSCGDNSVTPRAAAVASMLTEAFNRVLKSRDVALYDVLKQGEAVEIVFDPKKAFKTKDQDKEPSLEQIQQYLETYTSLKCMICHTHSCEHGEFDVENVRRCFSIDDLGGNLWKHVERRRDRQTRELRKTRKTGQGPLAISSGNSMPVNGDGDGSSRSKSFVSDSEPRCKLDDPCKNKCYRSYDVGDDAHVVREWTADETSLLRSFHMTFVNSTVKTPCTLCPLVGRYCWEVYRRAKELGLHISPRSASPPSADVPFRSPVVKPIAWYDRHRKVLNGDWSDHTYTHMHALREQREPCNHDGPCTAARGCICMEAKLLCERFCQCTDESCAIKFTGCACHVNGKTCYSRQKEGKPCICVQLNRECDPVLCGSCGARERADPENCDDDALHATGCQNVSLQRGKSKAVVLAQSQLQGCGYGLFTAEDIGVDEFIIEYVGELITHDEGVRREARRGDFFDQGANASYLFTLLEQDGIWVDAAIYGNLSRYINHASESDKRGCNVTPKILYVNGEFRIRFTAMRDIKAGEELFFNYGENFPNLTKKLLEDKASASDDEAMAVTNSAKSRSRGRNKDVRNSGRRSAASRSDSTRRNIRTIRGRASTNSVQGGLSSNGNTGGSSSIHRITSSQRRAQPRRGVRKEAPPAVVEILLADKDVSDEDCAVDHMDIDGGKRQGSRGTCKLSSAKRQTRLLDDDGEGDEEGDKGHNERSIALNRKRRLPDNDDHDSEQSRRNGRSSSWRQIEDASSAAVEMAAVGMDMAENPRRLRSQISVQLANQEQGKEIRAATKLGNSADSSNIDSDVDTDEQPRRKRPRIAPRRKDSAIATTAIAAAEASSSLHSSFDSNKINVDLDAFVWRRRLLGTRRTRQQNGVSGLAAEWLGFNRPKADCVSKAVSPAVQTGDDQGGVLLASQSYHPRRTDAVSASTENGLTTTTTTAPAAKHRSRRNVVPDSDDDLDLGASQTGRGGRTETLSQATAASPNGGPVPTPRVDTPLSRPHTLKTGGSHHKDVHKDDYGVCDSGSGHSRRILRSGEARPDSLSEIADSERGASSACPPRTHSTPVSSLTHSAGGDESGASSVNRSHRKRQLPARFRTDE